MTNIFKSRLSGKILSIILCIAMIVGCIPLTAFDYATRAVNASALNSVADPWTIDDWESFFPIGDNINTENAGGVWTDKSVFVDADAFANYGVSMTDSENLLVALSAIASNMTVTGQSAVPTDTILVLDVSGSMNNSNNQVAGELVESANTSIYTLLNANPQNRVGVVLYAASATVMLPLGRYTTGVDNQFFNYTYTETTNHRGQKVISNEKFELDADVVIEGTTTKPYGNNNRPTRTISGGTYIQSGIREAMELFTASNNTTTAGSVKRKPVLVLMSDGAPTYASNDYDGLSNRNMGDGSNSTSGIGFVTQLTASYVKNQISEHYDNSCLFYTLGLGTGNDSVATSVLNPDATSEAINRMWTTWDLGQTVAVSNNLSVRRPTGDTTINKKYVNSYFDAAKYTTGTNGTLAEALKKTFEAIVADIALQSQYFPTLVENSENLSGYVSFIDKIGKYMEVKDIKGILINGGTLFSGADLASNFVAGGGILGTYTEPTEIGNEMVYAVQQRLGLATADEARTVIGLAYENGQLYYNNASDFSNYIGWYANASGEFLGFWHEGITTMPNPEDPTLTDATRPVYINKSYGYLGAVNAHAKSDMMYATVQVREEIATGEQAVLFAVPAALIPTVTYSVTLDEQDVLKDVEVSGATAPIRLVYETGLDSAINEFTVADVVSAEYLATNTVDGKVNFYTNQYEADGSTGYGKVNTYSYFRPSRENDRYYYQETTLIYTDTDGTLYRGDAQPSGEMYHGYTVYYKNGTEVEEKTVYHRLTAETLATAHKTENDNTWYVPAGDVRRDYYGYVANKSVNTTETLGFSAAPYTDIEGHSVDDVDHDFVVGATLGNNGKLVLSPETGLKLSKTLEATATATDKTFYFKLSNVSDTSDNATYSAYKVNADGTYDATVTSVQFTSGTAQVGLKAGETLYIGSMTAGESFKIEEVQDVDYAVSTVNGAEVSNITVTVEENTLQSAAFVNADRGTGTLTVAKEIEHPYGSDYQIPDKSFTVTVTLSGVGTANATFNATHTDATNLTTDTSVTTVNGQFTYTLKHGELLVINGLPAGTTASVVENVPGEGFTAEYWDNGALGDGTVTVEKDRTVSVIVLNKYQHTTDATPVNITVQGSKTLTGRTWEADDSFTFRLEKWNADESDWIQIGTDVVVKGSDYVGTNSAAVFNFNNVFGTNEVYTEVGTYFYRVVEVEPEVKIGGISYDKTVHSFGVHVTDKDLDGALEIGDVAVYRPTTTVTPPSGSNGNYVVTANFTNTYVTSGSATVTIDINKSITNATGSPLATRDGFTFGLYDADNKLVIESQPTTERGFTRLVLNYTPEDLGDNELSKTITYTLKEIKPAVVEKGWYYDNMSYTVTVELTSSGGVLNAVIFHGTDNPGNAGTSITESFLNLYTPGHAELTVDFVSKVLSGREQKLNEFEFAIYSYDDTARANPLSIGKNRADGKVVFDKALTFEKVGTYFFDIVETTPDGNGVSVDKNTHRVTVTVTDVGGQLQASYTLVNAASAIVFRNTYTAQPVSKAITATKSLTGRALLNDEFTFTMAESDADGNALAGGKSYTAKNTNNNGSITFPEITYTSAGTYYYVVTENSAASEGTTFGIKYDERAFIVSLVVTDNGLGQLVAGNPTYSVKGNGAAGSIVFVNEYKALPTNAKIVGNKLLTGKILGGGDFEFKLYNSNSDWAELGLRETKTNEADGTINFTTLNFETAGKYYFIVKETNGGQTIDGITYDDTAYRVEIEVIDNLRGQLYAVILVDDQYNVPQEGVIFRNLYEITGSDTVTLTGEKNISGADRAPNDGEFTFELYEAINDQYDITGVEPETVTNKDGKFEFKLQFSPEHIGETFYYVVKEQNAGQTVDRMTYSSEQYKVEIEVLDNGVGGIKTVTTVNGGTVAPSALNITNVYTPKPDDIEVDISIIKKVENKGTATIGPKGFEFKLEKLGTDSKPTVKSDAEGKAKFTLEFTESDIGNTYNYKLTEIDGGVANVKYSEAVYNISITISLGADNKLVAAITQNELPVQSAEAVFVNEYDYTPLPPDVPKTGDFTTVSLWFAILFISGGVLVGAVAIVGKENKKKKN